MASTYSKTTTSGGSKSSTKGGSTSKQYASGKVSEETLKNKDKYGQQYVQSQAVLNAYQQLQEQNKNKPGAFQSGFQEQLNSIYDKIANREKFSFDVNENVMYDQLKDQYSALGKLAMQDTMGQAASMTGGYGNSYAQTAGQQTYQNYMQQLQEQIPDLYQMELSRYNQEGEDLMNQYGMAKDMHDTEYGKYRDELSDFYTERDYLNNQYQTERDFDYNQYLANRDYWTNQYWNEKNAEQTAESSNWQTTESEDWQTSTSNGYSSGSGSSGGSSGKNSNSNNKNVFSTVANATKQAANVIADLFGGKKSGTQATLESSQAPLSNEYVAQIEGDMAKMSNNSQRKNYLAALYNNKKITLSNLNYFLDMYGL